MYVNASVEAVPHLKRTVDIITLHSNCITTLSLPRSPFAQREQWLYPPIVHLVSLRRTNIVCFLHEPHCHSISISGFSQSTSVVGLSMRRFASEDGWRVDRVSHTSERRAHNQLAEVLFHRHHKLCCVRVCVIECCRVIPQHAPSYFAEVATRCQLYRARSFVD